MNNEVDVDAKDGYRQDDCNDNANNDARNGQDVEALNECNHKSSANKSYNCQETGEGIGTLRLTWTKYDTGKRDKPFGNDHQDNLRFTISLDKGNEYGPEK